MYSVKLSNLFTKTSKTVPADETARNARLLIQAGYVYKVMAGVYAYTPLGLQVVENIKQIVREEMNNIGGQELIMSSLQRKDTWDATGRWDDKAVDVWFKTKLQDGTELGLAWSHEETIVEMMKQHIFSYKDLPAAVYQFQTKLRNELRAKSGVMRGREFVMKDMYSCSADATQHEVFYNATIEAYNRVYSRIGIGSDTHVTLASGGAFTEFSHEFQTECEAGEDIIFIHRGKKIAINKEILNDQTLDNLGVKKDELEEIKSAEVGNIFNFGTQKSEQLDFAYTDETGQKRFVHLGSYGIGITRLVGVLAEKFSDERGLVWPEAVAPAQIHLMHLGEDSDVKVAADKLYQSLLAEDLSVIYDDRDVRPGQKLADADLFGMPWRVVLSSKTLAEGSVEVKQRTADESKLIRLEETVNFLKK